MNLKIPKRFSIIVVIVYFSFFAFMLIFSSFQFEPKTVDLSFRLGWVLNKALFHFFNFLVATQCLAVLLTFSIFLPKEFLITKKFKTKSKDLNTTVTILVGIIILLTALFFAGNEIIKPRSYKKLNYYKNVTQTARAYLSQAKESYKNGDFFIAENLITKYLFIKPKDEEGIEFKKEIKKRIINNIANLSNVNEETGKTSQPLNLSSKEAVAIARKYLRDEDYYSAYYYAQIALSISKTTEEAGQVYRQAWAKLLKTEPSQQEIENYRLFYQKKVGIDFLLSGKSIEAYYLFKKLITEYPDDDDVIEYFAESAKKALKLVFFIDEAKNALSFPGALNIYFLNKNTHDEVELCSFGKMAESRSGIYFKDIEIISLNRNGGIINHMSAPYGKLSDNHIILNGIDKENQNIKTSAEYYIKNYIPELSNTIKLNIDPKMLAGLSTDENIYKTLSFFELYEFIPVLANFGWPVQPLYIEIMNRILSPCEFILLSFYMIFLSWKYRRRTEKIPLVGIVFLPLIFYLIVAFTNTYQYSSRLLLSWFYLNYGKIAASALLTTSQIVLLILVFVLLAGMNIGEKNNAED